MDQGLTGHPERTRDNFVNPVLKRLNANDVPPRHEVRPGAAHGQHPPVAGAPERCGAGTVAPDRGARSAATSAGGGVGLQYRNVPYGVKWLHSAP